MWQRPALTRLVLKSYAAWRRTFEGVVEFEMVCVGSEGEASRNLVERAGWRYVEHENQPLGAKWNAGLEPFKELNIDALIIVGSDDVMSEGVVPFYLERLAEGEHAVGFSDMYALDLGTLEALYWEGYAEDSPRAGDTIGLGRCLSAEVLKRTKWTLWEDELNKTLDSSMTRTLRALNPPQEISSYVSRDLGFTLIDLKSSVNLNSLYAFTRTPRFKKLNKREVDELITKVKLKRLQLLRLSSEGELLPPLLSEDYQATRVNLKGLVESERWLECYVLLLRLVEVGQYDYIDLRNLCMAAINTDQELTLYPLLDRLFLETLVMPHKHPVRHQDVVALMVMVYSKVFDLERVMGLYEYLLSLCEGHVDSQSEPARYMRDMLDLLD